MNKIKIIKTEQDYQDAIKLLEDLMNHDPDPESAEGEQLSLLATLIEDYENKVISKSFPTPIEAIKFRMEQSDLKPIDLIPYIGSKSRVSEILSGKRQLTLEMIRSLEEGLGIPSKVLIKKADSGDLLNFDCWDKSIVDEMERRNYFGNATQKGLNKINLLKQFFQPFEASPQMVGMLRKSNYRSSPLTDRRALFAWSVRILSKAKKITPDKKFKEGLIDLKFLQNLVKLSTKENSPILAQKYLKENGITLVIEPHFSKTYLDGATILLNKDNPIIGLTLRHDRLDNFWFTLLHELAHISKHYNSGIDLFYDEIEGIKAINLDDKEKEADAMAEEAILPASKWEISPARLIPSLMAAKSLANELGVHIALIAGQIRHKGNKYAYLGKVVNEEKVRKYFPNEKWKK